MTALVWMAPNLAAILTAQAALQFVDRRRLGSSDYVEGYGLMGIAAEATNLQIPVTGIERVAKSR